MSKKKRIGNLTDEDRARHEKILAMVRERVAYHEAKACEEEARAQDQGH